MQDGHGAQQVPDPGLRVLVVEDDLAYAEHVLALLRTELPQAAVEVRSTLAGARTSLGQGPDCVVADLALFDGEGPDAEGLEVVGALRTACPEAAVVVLTRHDEAAYVLRAIGAGADELLVKGAHDGPQLAAAVLRAVRRVRTQQGRTTRERFAASLLDAAQPQTCAVDADGVVVSVNAPWRAFAAANGGEGLDCGIGVDYLATCDDAVGQRQDGAAEVAAGLRAVLAGTVDRFEHEYTCHSPREQRWFSARIIAQPQGGGAVVSHVDVTASRLADRARSRRSVHDPVTGLPDAVLLADRLEQALADGGRSGLLVALALVDVDQAPDVLAGQGPAAHDLLVVEVADRLTACLRDGDTLARLDGARFAVVWRDVSSEQEADDLIGLVARSLASPFALHGEPLELTARVGVAVDQWAQTGDELLLAAASALRPVPQQRCHDDVAPPPAVPAARTEAALREAMSRGELVVHYQPVVDLAHGSVVGVEALVRWQHPVDGLVPPDAFIPLAEAGGLIVALGAQVLQVACAQAVRWQQEGLPLQMAVNLSTRQVAHPDLLRIIARVLRETGLAPERLVLEVTESAVVDDAEAAEAVLAAIAALGVGLAIDDFGTGYSSLTYLQRYPIQALKVDRSFVAGMGLHDRDDAIVASVVSLARAVGGSCIAEGVETAEQYAALLDLGCDYGQGFLFGRAVPAEQLPAAILAAESVLGVLRQAHPQGASQRDHAGDRRDQAAQDRDQAGDRRDHAGDERDAVADRRDEVAERRDVAAQRRDQAGDRRDTVGTERDQAGTRRDEAADRRDVAADERDTAADRRDAAADERDDAAEQQDAAERQDSGAGDGGYGAGMLERSVLARRAAAADREQASEDRQAGASERGQAEHDRGTALADRGAGAGERSRAVLDRDIALADRGAGAGERTSAEHDRDTALADRDAGAGERTWAEGDRQTSSLDRGASARERADASVDGLTGAYRRTPGFVELYREVARARRTEQPLVVAFVDVDGLKKVNDRLGHTAGDAVLRAVATGLSQVLRPYDLVLRYGGDEFVCVLPGIVLEEAGRRLEQVVGVLAGGVPAASVSVGLAQLRAGEAPEDLVSRADAALYRDRAVRRRA